MSAPTAFPDLDSVLDRLGGGVACALGQRLCGVYLQGSFALGEADVYSDVDFVVAVHGELTESEQAALQGLHEQLFEPDVPWAERLEGSYMPTERLRRVDPARAKYLYLDNGANRLVWSDHCNTAVVRWVLREHGIVLSGPEPARLIDPVPPALLQAEALDALREYAAWAEESRARYEAGAEPGGELPFSRWQQPYLVLTFCRMLWTLRHGAVTTKRRAAEWALHELGPRWSGLVQQALDDRPDPWEKTRLPSTGDAVERTCAFIDDVLALAAGQSPRRR